MKYSEISQKVQETWNKIDRGYPGRKIRGKQVKYSTLPHLNSDHQLNICGYTKRLDARCCSPALPKPFQPDYQKQIPKDIALKVEMSINEKIPENFVAIIYFSTSSEHQYSLNYITNDLKFVKSHPQIQWIK